MTKPLRYLDDRLAELRSQSLLRRPPDTVESLPRGLVNLSSNDYLGLASEPLSPQGAALRAGAGASPLVVGTWPEHLAAERALTDWLGSESATLFTSGYAANVGAISCLVGPGDLVLSDRLNHASIIDGCRLSGARIAVYDHLDAAGARAQLAELRAAHRHCLVVTESYFSMDGDSPDLSALRSACDAYDAAFYVDEAHGLGVFGREGRGLCAEHGIVPDILVGTLGKALGLQGAFVAGSSALRSWLWNRARSLVFSTGLSPVIAGDVPSRVATVRAATDRRERLLRSAAQLRVALREGGYEASDGEGPIIPWVVGAPTRTLEVSEALRAEGVLGLPIRPPTVPAGTARLRLAVSAALSSEEIAAACSAVSLVARRFPG